MPNQQLENEFHVAILNIHNKAKSEAGCGVNIVGQFLKDRRTTWSDLSERRS